MATAPSALPLRWRRLYRIIEKSRRKDWTFRCHIRIVGGEKQRVEFRISENPYQTGDKYRFASRNSTAMFFTVDFPSVREDSSRVDFDPRGRRCALTCSRNTQRFPVGDVISTLRAGHSIFRPNLRNGLAGGLCASSAQSRLVKDRK